MTIRITTAYFDHSTWRTLPSSAKRIQRVMNITSVLRGGYFPVVPLIHPANADKPGQNCCRVLSRFRVQSRYRDQSTHRMQTRPKVEVPHHFFPRTQHRYCKKQLASPSAAHSIVANRVPNRESFVHHLLDAAHNLLIAHLYHSTQPLQRKTFLA